MDGTATGVPMDGNLDAIRTEPGAGLPSLHGAILAAPPSAALGVPVPGGLPVGHGSHPPTIPLDTEATIDTATGTPTVLSAVVQGLGGAHRHPGRGRAAPREGINFGLRASRVRPTMPKTEGVYTS